ncbi:pyridoxal phosphate-dependent transferase [Russula earlei]|uniref:Pyridoxal phosphate-dependent transferase n=1 Tax=Russula earlei TaxID=71964 RepID=A0ACC0U2P9_9AGAM|nr:pyridoxal phosphate-dependent transferase [Russula earlei]
MPSKLLSNGPPAPEKRVPPSRPTAILHRTPSQPPIAVSGEGINVTLDDGRVLIDAIGGVAVACIGNGHRVVQKAIRDQADKLAYVYNLQLSNEPAEELARMLVDSGKGAFEYCGFFAGGSEAMEGAMKLARQYWFEKKQPQRKNFISRHLSYHGNTVTTLSLSGHPTRRVPFEEILHHDNFHKVSPAYAKRFQRPEESEEQYVERLCQELEDTFLTLGPDTVIGFVAETVVGTSTGALAAPKGYFKAIKSVCRKYSVLFILDEIMCGMGRMGTTHAWESFGDNEPPDIQTVAKGLGGGYASIGAVLVSKEVAEAIRDNNGFWKHGHTYQAHPLSCATAIAVQKVIAAENLLENGRQTGEYLAELLRERLQSPGALAEPFTFDVRGGGSFWAVEFDFTGPTGKTLNLKGKQFASVVTTRCMEHGLLVMGRSGGANIKGTEGDHIILAPAYNITKKEVERVVDLFVESVEEVLRESL